MLDYAPGAIVYLKFPTVRPSTGAPFTLAGSPVVSVYKNDSTTQSTAGVALTVDFDGITGLNHVTIDTSADGTFYSAGASFQVVITTGTVDSVSVVGQVVSEFTLNRASVLRPTTEGRTLDVSAGGEAGIDWANVGSPTTTVNFSGTTIKTATDVETDTADIQTRLPAALVSGRIDASVGAMAANVVTASALATDAVTEIQSGLMLAASYTAPDNASITAIKAKTDNLPSDPADASDIAAAFSTVNTTLGTIAGYVDTEVAAIKTTTDTLLARIVGTLASGTHNPQSGDAFARLGAPAGASIAADIAAIDGGGGGGSYSSLITGPVVRNLAESVPIQFGFPSASATLSGTVYIDSDTTGQAIQGAMTFLNTIGTTNWYRLAYDADDRPTQPGVAKYVITDGTDTVEFQVYFSRDIIGQTQVATEEEPELPTILLYVDSIKPKSKTVTDADGNEVSLVGRNLRFVVNNQYRKPYLELTPTVSGASFTFTPTQELVSTERDFFWALRDLDDDKEPVVYGVLSVRYAAVQE